MVNGKEILGLVEGKKGLVGVTLSIREPEIVGEDEGDREGTEEGILVVRGEGGRVVKALEAMEGLRLCDVSMFELEIEEVGKVLDGCKELGVLAISVGLGREGWKDVFEALSKWKSKVEVLEIVGVPGTVVVEMIEGGGEVGVQREMLEVLAGKWKGLGSVKPSILRTKGEEWIKDADEGWMKKV